MELITLGCDGDDFFDHHYGMNHYFEYKNYPILDYKSADPWIYYGANNLLPEQIIRQYANCPIHQSIINLKSKYTAGKGVRILPTAVDFAKKIDLGDGLEGLIYKISLDLVLFGGFCLEIRWNKYFDKIDDIIHHNFTSVRVGESREQTEEGKHRQGVWLSGNWELHNSKEGFQPKFYPFFNPDKPNREESTFLYVKRYTPGEYWYPLPDWWAAYNPIETYIALNEYQKNNAKRGFMAMGALKITNNMNSDDRKKMEKYIKTKLQGADNAGSVLLFTGQDAESVTWVPFEGNDPSKNNISDNISVAREDIIMAHGLPSATLVGLPGGASLGGDGNTIDTATEIFFDQSIKSNQKMILSQLQKLFEIAKVPTQIEIVQLLQEKNIEAVEEKIIDDQDNGN